MFIVSILEAFSIGLILPISQLIFNDSSIFTKYLLFEEKSKNILFFILLFVSLIIIKNIFFSFVYYRISIFSEKIRNKLAGFIFNKYIYNDYLEYLKLKPGETIRNLSSISINISTIYFFWDSFNPRNINCYFYFIFIDNSKL